MPSFASRVATLAAVAVAMLTASVASAQALGPSVSISIVDAPRVQSKWGYAPTTRKIAPGTWVTWSNDGQETHTVTAVDRSFDSGDLDPSEGFSWYFDQPGTYQYTCVQHPWMTGTIVVGDGQGSSTGPSATSSSQPAPAEMSPPSDDVSAGDGS